MRKQAIVCVLLLGAALAFAAPVRAQQIEITEMAGLAQIFGEAQDNDVPLSMNDMDMVSGGYLLYETEVEANGEEAVLAVENIRDYAAVYVGEKRYGELSDTHKELTLALPEGTHKLQLGWGMGEVWVNNEFVGTYWENNLQQSIQVPAGNLKEGENTVVVFELKNNGNSSLSLSDKIVFK